MGPLGYAFVMTLNVEAAKLWVSKEEHLKFIMGIFIFESVGALFGASIEFLYNVLDYYDIGYLVFFTVLTFLCIASVVLIHIFKKPPFPPEMTNLKEISKEDQLRKCI